MQYRIATESDLELLWNLNIENHLNDNRWVAWKKEFIDNNRLGMAKTFLVINDNKVVGEGTLLLSPNCNAVAGKKELCNGNDVANINALRIQKQYEGQGHISKLVYEMEHYAVNQKISKLTIGVEATETRNLAIYLHVGFTEFLFAERQEGDLVLYFGKSLTNKLI